MTKPGLRSGGHSWELEFMNPQSWPGLTVGMSREIFERDKVAILAAAKIHGYRILGASRSDPYAELFHLRVIDFVKLP